MAVIRDVGVEADISGFSAGASDAEHAKAVLALAQQLSTKTPQNHVAAYTASLSEHLGKDASAAQRITAFDFLAALALVHPPAAYEILLEPATGLLQLCTAAASIDEEDGEDELPFHFAAMLAAIADLASPPTHTRRSELHVFFQQDTHQGPNHLRPQPTSSKDSYTSLYAQPPHNHTTRLSSVRLSSEQTQVERLRKMAAHKQCEAERKAADAASSGTPMSKEEAEEEEDTKA
ncbi:unnamed protein product [Tilletia controversa]|uniref:Uncharacterized protein n=3 Tax=Tilletia TaxID=13289 RepID=A0A8X7MRB2_9BASI|nr:hypothetical protein CF328_g6955 [Tilletia controversa]KAE8187859.1 hypothetical protein CF336_g6399 [Tilletia laevis]KAE8249225.1 hypothetical protein A4X03_0g6644 [Tilletia caries]KAE8192914.1 hypothetical protein CF335_g5724 [Tilletia laevis]KAE8245106.1 hypothetical protein A4X06_0g5819 [Tilletia controversa]